MNNLKRIKKGGNPSQPDHRPDTSTPTEHRKPNNIIHEIVSTFKRANWWQRILLPFLIVFGLLAASVKKIIEFLKSTKPLERVLLLLLLCLFVAFVFSSCGDDNEAQKQEEPEYIFMNDDGVSVDWQTMTDAWAAEAGMEKRYDITDAERWVLASVITAEAVGEPYAGKVAVAQCILQACEDDDIRPYEAIKKYGYSKHRPDPCKEALEAVQAVFDFGHRATAEPIKYYYAPARVHSNWHETQDYVLTINNHKFFKEAK